MTQEEFLKGVGPEFGCWNSHRSMLWLALQETRGSSRDDVLEMGMGDSSTPFLHQYCMDNHRRLLSVDNTEEWTVKFKQFETGQHVVSTQNWETAEWLRTVKQPWSVALVDHAPGERRIVDIELLKDSAQILVLHDTEEASYGWARIWHLFKYRVQYILEKGANATALSNTIDLSKWAGQTIGGYTIEVVTTDGTNRQSSYQIS